MRKYFISREGRNAGECVIEKPANPDNLLIVEYSGSVYPEFGATWDGVEFTNPPIVIVVPPAVSFFQGCAALDAGGYLDAVEAYMSGPATAVEKLAWRTITEIRRASPLTSKLAAMLGLTEAQVDDLFILAATIEA